MSRVTFLAILLSLLVSTVIGCREQETGVPSPELNDRIVYVSEEGICTINPEGTDLKVIVLSEERALFSTPKWSPDKRRIAFNGLVDRHNRIMVVSSEGSDLEILGFPKPKTKKSKPDRMRIVMSEEYDLYFYGWSPSGRHLLYYHPFIDGSEIGIMNSNGEIITRRDGASPHFLGNNRIVYIGYYGGATMWGEDIFSAPIKQGEKQNLTNDAKISYFSPTSSPDGGKIVIGCEKGRKVLELWIMDADGLNKKKLASNDKDFEGWPLTVITFSPDGQEILFLAKKDHRGSIYVLNVDGTNLRTVVSDIAGATSGVCWSPDSKKILFTSDKDGNLELYMINIDGTGLKRLTNNNIKDCCPDW